jgi:hypothetical protein
MITQKALLVGSILVVLLFSIWLIPDQSNPAILPGWHTTVFLFDFVSIFSKFFLGLLWLQIVLLMTRRVFRLENLYSIDRMDTLNWVILIFGILVGSMYLYVGVIRPLWYDMLGLTWQRQKFWGHFYNLLYVVAMLLPFLPQLFWAKKRRQSVRWTFWICLACITPFLLEKLIIVLAYCR